MQNPADIAVSDVMAALEADRLASRAKVVREAAADLATCPTISTLERLALHLLATDASDWTLAKLGRMIR